MSLVTRASSAAPPSCFISYSWDSPEHRAWVVKLATALRSHGVNAIVDAFHAPLGADLTSFMARLATTDFVLIVCTPRYRLKSRGDASGGVGYEQAIITGHIFSGASKPQKFIPLLRAGELAEAVPDYLLNRHAADFRDDARFDDVLQQLLRAIFVEPERAAPPIGPRPALGAAEPASPAYRVRYFESFELTDDDPVAAPRYEGIWVIGQDGPWSGAIRDGVYRLVNRTDPNAVKYGYVGLGQPGEALDDLSDARVHVDVAIGAAGTTPFTGAGLMFRFDRTRRFYTGLIVTRHGGAARGQLQLVVRDEAGLRLSPVAPTEFGPSGRVTLGILGRGGVLDLFADDRLVRSVPAPAGLRGDPGLVALSTGEFTFDNFTIAGAE